MPPKKTPSSSPYFQPTSIRKSTRVSTASSTPAKKRPQPPSSESESGSEDDDDGSASEFDSDVPDEKPKGRGRASKKVKRDDDYESGASETKDDEEDEEEDDSDDESKPMKVTVIPLPKLRPDGEVEYEDSRIHENTILFLRDLKKHNNRDWMKFNDGEFRRAQQDFQSFITELTTLVVEKDTTIPELPSKDIIFRIYRDVRFSKDPTPYKAHFSAAWSRTGKKGPYAAYYLHLEPNNKSFIGGGLWQPDGPALDCLRTEIDQNPQDLKRVLMDKNFRKVYFPLVKGKKEEDMVKAFCEKNKEGALKTKPRGFEVTHPEINLLRLKSFTVGQKIMDEELTNQDSLGKIADMVGCMVPFITYLNSVVMPDRRRTGTGTGTNNPPAAVPVLTTTGAAGSSGSDEEEEEEEEE